MAGQTPASLNSKQMLGGLLSCELPQGTELEPEKGLIIPSLQKQAVLHNGQEGHEQRLDIEKWGELESRQMSMEKNQLETWELCSAGIGWGLLPSPRDGGMSTWPLMKEGQRAVLTGVWAELRCICSGKLNTVPHQC